MRRPVPAALLSIAVAASTTLGAAGASAATDADPASTGIPAATMPSGAGAPASDDPAGRVAPGLLAAEGEVSAFVELAAPSALDVTERGGDAAAVERAARHVEDLAASVVPSVAGEDEPSGGTSPERLSVTTNVVAGAVVRGDARSVRELAAAPGVVGLHRIVPKRVGNVASNVLTRTLAAWRSTGGTGEGVRVGVVDTGLDYTHAHFGGPGTVEAYAAAYGTDGTGPVPADATDPAKYLGGHDFAGPTYDASGRTPGSTRTPRPDANPVDPRWSGAATAGHGTHVTGIGFGYGVLPDGTTFRGDHDALTDLSGWQVGPGSAPRAGVYALKVFGDAGGTTELVLPALDWAMDPDGDGDVSDHLDVVNLSLGENFLPADDPESLFVDRLAEVGVLTVLGAGGTSDQPGDAADTIGAPGNARSGLTVANSIGDARLLDSVEVTRAPDPDAVGTHPAQSSTAYAGDDDVEAPVVFLGDDVTGCAPLTRYADRVAGAVVWLSWDDSAQRECGSGVRFDHAQAAGAVGVLVGTELSDFPVKLGGNGAIPGAQLSAAATDLLLPQIRTGDVTVRLGPSLRETSYVVDESLQDTLSGDSPRGVHGSLGVVKPDVAAPGAAILSARSGTGTGDGPLSGTSMAAPHVAGIAALVRAAHPDWTAAQIKAAVMNTATHDVHLDQEPLSPVHGPLRVGSGRVDAADAVRTTTLAWATEDPAQVSVSFGVVPVGAEPVRRRTTVTVENTGDRPVDYRTSVALATTSGGATITASPEVLTVRPGARELVTLTLDADPATLRKEPDPTSERIGPSGAPAEFLTAVSGRLVLSAPDAELRVPVVAAPRLVSDLTAEPVTFAAAGAATAPLELTGRGVAAGGWTSLLAPMQLVATSPRLDLATGAVAAPSAVASGDLRAVGFASTVPQRSADDPTGSRALIGVGIATHGSWANLGSEVTLQVDTDVDGDGATDFHTRVVKFGAGDLTVARTYRAGPTPTWLQDIPVNTVLGDVDTTVFDSDVVVVPISVAALGLTPGTTPTMTVSSWSQYAPDPSGRIDGTEPFTVDPFHPQYWFDGGTPGSLLFRAAPGTPVSVHRRAAPGAPAPQLLVLHLHNATTAARAQVVDVVAPVATPTTTTLTVTGTPAVGSPLTLAATVTPAAAAGTVELVAADGTVLASPPVRDGVATAPVRLGGGEHQVTARFVPADVRWASSASAPVTVVVPREASTVRLRLSDRAISYGDPTTATVQVSAGAGMPSGTVRLVVADAVVGTAPVVVDADDPTTGTAVVGLPRDLPVGGHRVTATFTGSADVAPSSADVRLRIVPAAPALTLTAPSWTVRPGSTPTVTVTVAGAAGAPAPTGRVTVLVNLRRVGTADLGPDGRVAVTLPPLDRGAVVTAVYGGDQGYRPDVDVRAMRLR